jgi:UDP:flavonoid glycosyltransferase YjiC (YdhE family)
MRSAGNKQQATSAPAETRGEQFDIIIAGDMTLPGDRAFRVALEIRRYSDMGLRVGVLQASQPAPGSRISQQVQSCVRRKLAEVVDPAVHLATELLVVHGPSEVAWSVRRLARIKSQRTLLVCHRVEDYTTGRTRQHLRGSVEILWAPTNPWLRKAAPAGLELTPDDWLPMFDALPAVVGKSSSSGPATIGWLISEGSVPVPASTGDQLKVLAVRVDHEPTSVVEPAAALQLDQLSLDRLARFDALAYFPPADETQLPDTVVWAALNQGRIVALPEQLKAHYGAGPLYCTADGALAQLAHILGDEHARNRQSNTALRAAKKRQTATSPETRDSAKRPADCGELRPVMFVASNGVGIGHVSRLLSVARRLDPDVPVVFVTQAQAVGVIERLGYLAEYIPSSSYIGGSFAAWDSWFRFELEQLIDAYDPALVVYDGNNPSNGLVEAVASRQDCRLVWVRRGLWGNTTSQFLDNARWFDLILEPGELDGQLDEGVTAQRRHEAKMVAPIRLLDTSELLSKAEAAKALGLDPARPAVLVQLGAGFNRDVVSLIDQLVAELQKFPQLQICVAEWVNGAHALNYWPDVKYLRGFPLSQYFRAFDFSIAAAGYNTFHELIGFGVPTIFIPNRHPSMDDQAGRAMHAQNLHAAFELEEEDLADLPELVILLMNAKARDFLSQNCRGLRRPNGARDAAQSLTELARTAT